MASIARNFSPEPAYSKATGAIDASAREVAMAKMCSLSGCKADSTLCIHEKMMIGMGLMLMAGALAHWGLHLV
jgi:hypothetical protein